MVGGERRVRNHKFPTRTHGGPRGDTQLCWTRPDQLETRTWPYQIPTISSRCRLLYSSSFSCSSLTPGVMALERQKDTQDICLLLSIRPECFILSDVFAIALPMSQIGLVDPHAIYYKRERYIAIPDLSRYVS